MIFTKKTEGDFFYNFIGKYPIEAFSVTKGVSLVIHYRIDKNRREVLRFKLTKDTSYALASFLLATILPKDISDHDIAELINSIVSARDL